jgi:hypothetical protein
MTGSKTQIFSRLGIRHVAAAVAAHAHIGLLGMGGEALENAQPRAILADQRRRFVGEHLLVGAGLEEFSHPQAAGVARGLFGRQRVVRPDHLVAVGDVGARPQKQRAVILHVGEEIIGIARHHLHVLGGDAVGLAHHFGVVLAHDDLAEIRPGLASGVGGGKDREQPLDLVHGVAGELL